MKITLTMYKFNSLNHLNSNHKRRFKIKPPTIINKQIFQRLSVQIHNHNIIFALASTVINMRDTKISGSIITD